VEIAGEKTRTYHDIQEAVAARPEETIPVKVEREGRQITLQVTPRMDKSTGAGIIGVYFWTDPVIAEVAPGSPAALAGLREGDRILRVNGREVAYTVALYALLRDQPAELAVDFLREEGGEEKELHTGLVPVYNKEGEGELGIKYRTLRYHSPRLSPPAALAAGFREMGRTFVFSVKSLSLLFRGIDLTQAVSGPVRITYMVGDAAAAGFGQSLGAGLRAAGNFLALISVALCIMNLLPLPVLDGGMTVLFLIEAVFRRPLNPRMVYAFQTVGVVIIFGLMAFAVFGDILFFARR